MSLKKSILFICTHNSARSQIAEGLVNHFYSNEWEAFSAGTEKTKVRELAILAMKDIGIDIRHHYSKTFHEFLNRDLDFVITVCDSAKDTCPYFPGAGEQIHAPFTDPSDMVGSEQEQLKAFIATRNMIKEWLDKTLPNLRTFIENN